MRSLPPIIATIGPASYTPHILRKLDMSGLGMARLNFSWGTHESHKEYIENIRKNTQEVSILQDLSGPRVVRDKDHTYNAYASVFTEKDREDLLFGLKEEVEWVALSFVRDSQDIREVRSFIQRHTPSTLPHLCAKIERPEAIENMEDIAKLSDALMIARGDLNSFLTPERIHEVIEKAMEVSAVTNTPVCVATNLLTSMIENSIPTPEEMEYIHVLKTLGIHALVLSNETATGKHPVEAVRIAYQAFCG